MRTRLLLLLAALPLAALAGACSPEEREASPLSDPQLESPLEPPLSPLAAAAAGADTMTIIETVPAGGGWPSINVADYWDPPYFGHIPPLDDLPLRIVTKNQQGDTVGERVITRGMMTGEEVHILPNGEEWVGDLVLTSSAMRADLLVLKDTDSAGYRQSVEWIKSGLGSAHPDGDSLVIAEILRGL